MSRVRIAKDKAEFVKSLVTANSKDGVFETYADVVMFAASLGVKQDKRLPLGGISTKDPAPIGVEIFASRGYDLAIKLIAIAQTQDPQILSSYEPAALEQRLHILEEYANGVLEILREALRGSIDYTERLLLMLIAERVKPKTETDSFDLSRFL
uniref:DNA phosphorothioation-associated protein 4 n=1 Tax=Desertifilum tharense IPPAS B-1220 TaxID=1781255 RepID=A0ACD5GXG9_9CYAN